jgi:hypothetical protein
VVRSDPELPLSPELVLVAPEFGEHALVQEHNGLPPPSAARPLVVPAQAPPAPPAEVLPAPTTETPPLPPAQAPPPPGPPAPPVYPEASPPEPRWRLTVGGAAAIVLSAIAVFGAGFLISRYALSESTSQPVVAQQAAPPQTTVAAVTQVATPQPRISAPAPSKPVAAPAPVPTQQATPASTTAPTRSPKPKARRKPEPTPKMVRPLPDGGYVLPGGRFQVSRNGRAISGFTLDKTCAGQIVVPQIGVEPTGAFAFMGHPTGSSATIQVKGRFVTPTEARGTTLVRGSTCRGPAISFVAHLS